MLVDYNKYNLILILFIIFTFSGCAVNKNSLENKIYIKSENLLTKFDNINKEKLDIVVFFEKPEDLEYCIENIMNISDRNINLFPINLLNEKEISNFFNSNSNIRTIIILSKNNEKVALLAKLINNEATIFTNSSYKKLNIYNITLSLKNKVKKLLETLEPQSYIIPIFNNSEKIKDNWEIIKNIIDETKDIYLIDIIGYHTKDHIYLNKKESIISKIISYITLHSISKNNRKYVILVLDELSEAKEYLNLMKESDLQLDFISPEFSKNQISGITTLRGNEFNEEKALIFDIFSVIKKSKMNSSIINSNEFDGMNSKFLFKQNEIQYLLEVNEKS